MEKSAFSEISTAPEGQRLGERVWGRKGKNRSSNYTHKLYDTTSKKDRETVR